MSCSDHIFIFGEKYSVFKVLGPGHLGDRLPAEARNRTELVGGAGEVPAVRHLRLPAEAQNRTGLVGLHWILPTC